MEQHCTSPVKKQRVELNDESKQAGAAHEWTGNAAIISNVVSACSQHAAVLLLMYFLKRLTVGPDTLIAKSRVRHSVTHILLLVCSAVLSSLPSAWHRTVAVNLRGAWA
jgi:hypothetical protein